jgi:hypothetical protein
MSGCVKHCFKSVISCVKRPCSHDGRVALSLLAGLWPMDPNVNTLGETPDDCVSIVWTELNSGSRYHGGSEPWIWDN